jgi:hypothetical protein
VDFALSLFTFAQRQIAQENWKEEEEWVSSRNIEVIQVPVDHDYNPSY